MNVCDTGRIGQSKITDMHPVCVGSVMAYGICKLEFILFVTRCYSRFLISSWSRSEIETEQVGHILN
jgi:hypothetical protein